MTRKYLNRIMSIFEYTEFTSSIHRAWKTFIEKGVGSKEILRPEIIESWERAKKFGVDPFQLQINELIQETDLNRIQEKNDKLLSFARPDMKYLAQSMEGSETIITISDKNGLILDMYGDPSILKEGEKIHFMPGAVWSEEVGGTNAIGTVIKNKQPVQILFTEHFCTGWHDWICAAAPILNPLTGELFGVLDISGKWKNVHPHTLGLAIVKAKNIANSIEKTIFDHGLQQNPFLVAALSSLDDGILLADGKKNILKINARLQSFLNGMKPDQLSQIPEIEAMVDLVLQGKERYVEQEVSLSDETQRFVCSVHPVIMDQSHPIGAVVRLRRSSPKVQTKESNNRHVTRPNSSTRYTFDHMIGSSAAFLKVVDKARKAASLTSTLFLSGETGTGKELFAQAIHNASDRRDKPFVAINCGAIPRELIECELFGYEPGAFTGAKAKGNPGKFELAQGGTIFLDEIGDMPLNVQVHLLRALEERVVTRIGGHRPIPIDVRVIAATHKNLMEAVEQGEFREDLLFRLRVIQLRLPALRERSEDIPQLVEYFMKQLSGHYGKSDIRIHPETMEILKTYSWPGNIRELKNVVEQALFNMEGDMILPCDLPPELAKGNEQKILSEKDQFLEAIRAVDGSITQAAERLGISRATMYRKMKQWGITAEDWKGENLVKK
jgi:sigma-54 dependent transcriptional regulator, acetoin dehydrogenase operon transcriptional activator AcoR